MPSDVVVISALRFKANKQTNNCFRNHSSAEGISRSTDYQTRSKNIHSSETVNANNSDINRESGYDTSASRAGRGQYPPRYDTETARNYGSSFSDPGWGRRVSSDTYSSQNGTDTESSCSVSTVREAHPFQTNRQNSQSSRLENQSSFDSSQSATKLHTGTGQAAPCNDKTIDDVLHSHEAKTDNMKNMTRDMGNKMSKQLHRGIGREISTDSGIADLLSSTQPASPVSEPETFASSTDGNLVPRSSACTTTKHGSTSTFQNGNSQKTVKRDDNSIESTDTENASKGIFMTKAEQSCGNIDGVETVESHQSSSSALTATGTASKLKTSMKGDNMITESEFEGDSRLARQESSQSAIETDNAKLTKEEDVKQEVQSKITESSKTTQGRRGSNSSTVSTSKQENTKKESINKSTNESKIEPDGSISEVSKSEDSKSIASSFSGKSTSQETKGGKTYKSISKQSSTESKTKNVSETKSYSSTSTDGTLTDGNRAPRPELRDAENFTRTYDLGIDELNDYDPYVRRNSGSSGISGRESIASSIASSASAMYEREQKKKREQEAAETVRSRNFANHTESVDSITKAKQIANSKYNKNDSDSLRYQNKFSGSVTNPTTASQRERRYESIPRSDSMFSSFSDDVFMEETPVSRQRDTFNEPPRVRETKSNRNSEDNRNRRATLQGDIILTEREVFKTRDEIRSNPRGRDDSFISSHDESYYSSKDRLPGFDERTGNKRHADGDVIEREIVSETLSEEDILFGREDDFFGSADSLFARFKSKPSRMGLRRDDDFFSDSLFERKLNARGANPYTTREDLSKMSHESLNDQKPYRKSKTDSSAMSDSALRSPASHNQNLLRTSKYGYSGAEFDDRASARSLPPQSESGPEGVIDRLNQRLNVTSDRSKSYVQDYINRNSAPNYGQTINRLQSYNSHPSLGVSAEETRSDYDSGLFSSANASDSAFSAGRSIDRNTGRSIPQNNYNSSTKSFRDKNLISDNRSRRHLDDGCYGELDMNDDGSTCPSSYSLPPDASASQYRYDNDTRRYPDVKKESNQNDKVKGEENAEWDSRRQRIDKALSWIRTELVSTIKSYCFILIL